MAKPPLYSWQIEAMGDNYTEDISPEYKLKKFLNQYDTPEKILNAKTDEDILFDIINADYNWLPYYIDDLRAAAIEKIDSEGNEDFFMNIIKNNSHHGILNAAIKKIDYNQKYEFIFIKLADNGVDEAINKLSEETLGEIVGNKEINDSFIDYGYTKTIIDDTDSKICYKILNHISDEKIIKDLGLKYPNKEIIAKFVIKNTNNQNALTKIALCNDNNDICLEAIRKISDVEKLTKIVYSSEIYDICVAAINRISDKNILENISKNASSIYVRDFTKRKLNIKDKSISITLSDEDKSSIEQIEDKFYPLKFCHVGVNNSVKFTIPFEKLPYEYIDMLPTNGQMLSGDALDPHVAWTAMKEQLTNDVKKYWPINSKYDIYIEVTEDNQL